MSESNKEFMPISLDLADKEILIIGGGKQGTHKVELLLRFTSKLRVVSKDFTPKLIELAKNNNIPLIRSNYRKFYLRGAFIVYACTDNRELNKKVLKDGHKRHLLVNVADDPKICDFVSPAIYIEGDMRVAVSSNGKDVHKSIKWRNKIKDFINSDRFRDTEQK